MPHPDPAHLFVRLARTAQDLQAAQRLRYSVFVAELGARGPLVDHAAGLEADDFDAVADHLLLIDPARPLPDQVVGVYRLMTQAQADRAGGFYSSGEYDLAPLVASGRVLLELGRSCLHPAYRGGLGMFLLWQALAEKIRAEGIEILFGTASFHGTDISALAPPLALLHHRHLAPADLRPKAIGARARAMDLVPEAQIDRKQAMIDTPALIKAYLRLGGVVGEGAFVDPDFNTTDVCLVLDIARMSDAQRALYASGGRP